LGLAFGLLSGLGLFGITAVHVATQAEGLPLYLLKQFFRGYSMTWPGAFIGLAWGFGVGFVAGWLLGFVHNFTVGMWLFIIRTRQDLRQTKNFLDHI
jgi:Na+-driven multidrug efflux pump